MFEWLDFTAIWLGRIIFFTGGVCAMVLAYTYCVGIVWDRIDRAIKATTLVRMAHKLARKRGKQEEE
jgi:hypothetical protein